MIQAAPGGFPLTGTALFTAGSVAVVGTGTLFTTEVRCGDYVILWADFMTTAPLRWGRVAAITDNTHLTLEAAYAGPGAAVAGATRLARWVIYQDGVSGGESNGASIERVSTGVGAAGQSGIFRAVGVPGGKQGLPIDLYWYGSVSARNGANQTCTVEILSASAAMPCPAGILWSGADPDTTIRCRSSGYSGGSDLWEQVVVMPGGALAVNYHLYRIRMTLNRVDFWVDPHLNPTPVASHQWHVPYPYGNYGVYINAYNTGVPTGNVDLLTDEVIIINDDDVRAEVEQPDASKLRASTVDITPNGPALGVPVAVDSDLVHTIAATVAGQRYRVSVIGGAGVCIRVDGVNAVITDEPWQSDQKFVFIATVTSATGVTAIKRTAGTADLVVLVVPLV